jgi:DNA-binding transcriptional LysR family regulator
LAAIQLCLVQSIDLNLLPVVLTLLEEENVTQAAARLNLSVPATSRALDRARRLFDDPLLVRSGRGVVMTPRARALLPELTRTMNAIADVTDRPGSLVPARIRRTFVIRANEAVIAAAGTDLISIARSEAPHAALRFELEGADDMVALRRGDVDLAIGSYSDVTSDVVSEELLDEQLIAVVRCGHPFVAANGRVNLERFAVLDHIDVSRKGRRKAQLDQLFAASSLRRSVLAVVPSFAVALAMVARSDATAIVPSRLASLLVDHGAITTYRPPVALPVVAISQLWHASNTDDPPHQWLRDCVRRAASNIA